MDEKKKNKNNTKEEAAAAAAADALIRDHGRRARSDVSLSGGTRRRRWRRYRPRPARHVRT